MAYGTDKSLTIVDCKRKAVILNILSADLSFRSAESSSRYLRKNNSSDSDYIHTSNEQSQVCNLVTYSLTYIQIRVVTYRDRLAGNRFFQSQSISLIDLNMNPSDSENLYVRVLNQLTLTQRNFFLLTFTVICIILFGAVL